MIEPVDEEYHVGLIERLPLGTPYPVVVERIKALMTHEYYVGKTVLLADRTGVGVGVTDMMVAAGMVPIGITITGGQDIGQNIQDYTVPKRNLVMALTLAFQKKKLKIQKDLAFVDILKEEIQNFRYEITETGRESYNARSGTHDDLLLSLAIGVWYLESGYSESQIFL